MLKDSLHQHLYHWSYPPDRLPPSHIALMTKVLAKDADRTVLKEYEQLELEHFKRSEEIWCARKFIKKAEGRVLTLSQGKMPSDPFLLCSGTIMSTIFIISTRNSPFFSYHRARYVMENMKPLCRHQQPGYVNV